MNAALILGQQQDFINRIDGDALAAATIIAVVGIIVVCVVLTVCVTVTIQRVVAIRESNKLIMELVNRGFSADEIESITYGNMKLSKKVGKMFRDARNAFRTPQEGSGQMPAPPVKAAG
jgi:hypothetical protein